jgi:hypothetical protein
MGGLKQVIVSCAQQWEKERKKSDKNPLEFVGCRVWADSIRDAPGPHT